MTPIKPPEALLPNKVWVSTAQDFDGIATVGSILRECIQHTFRIVYVTIDPQKLGAPSV